LSERQPRKFGLFKWRGWKKKFEELESALESARRAVKLQPEDARFHFYLGTILTRVRRVEEAKNEFQLFEQLEERDKKLPQPGVIDRGSWKLGDSSPMNLNTR